MGEDLWVMLGQSMTDHVAICVVRRDGQLGPRLSFPDVVGAWPFAVDSERRRIYFATMETAELLRMELASIPEGLVPVG